MWVKTATLLAAATLAVTTTLALTPKASMAAELSEIRDRGYLIVAVKNNRPPLGFIDGAGHLNGFEIDIAQRLAEELLGDRTAVKLVPVRNVDRVNVVLEDRVDIAIAAITLTEPRRRIISFSEPYYLDGVAFITRSSAQLSAQQANTQQIRDLRAAEIAVLEGSSTVSHVRYLLPGAQLVGVRSYAEGRQLLTRGDVEAFAGDASVLSGWLLEPSAELGTELETELDNQSYRLLPNIISAEPLSIAIPKGRQYDPLRTLINQAIRRWYAEGWLQERAAAWGLPAESTQFLERSLAQPRP